MFVYVLKLKQNKYYVGTTANSDFKLDQYINDFAWTTRYQPLKLIELIPIIDDFDEDKYTLKYMGIYGANNVRGGNFSRMILNKNDLNTIEKMINVSKDKCYKCGLFGHFSDECRICDTFDCEKKEQLNNIECEYTEVYRCDYCYKEFDTMKEATYHENFYCENKKNKNINKN